MLTTARNSSLKSDGSTDLACRECRFIQHIWIMRTFGIHTCIKLHAKTDNTQVLTSHYLRFDKIDYRLHQVKRMRCENLHTLNFLFDPTRLCIVLR